MSGRGPVPRLTEAIINEPIQGSWWAHPKSHEIFATLQTVTDSEDVLVCRLIEGKVTLVDRRLWPALVRLASRFPAKQLAKVSDEHTPSGRHVSREIPFPQWVPPETIEDAKNLSEEEALIALGNWATAPDPPSGCNASGAPLSASVAAQKAIVKASTDQFLRVLRSQAVAQNLDCTRAGLLWQTVRAFRLGESSA